MGRPRGDRISWWRQRHTKLLKRSLTIVELFLVLLLALVTVGLFAAPQLVREVLGVASFFEIVNLGITVIAEPTLPRIYKSRRCPTCEGDMISMYEWLICSRCGGEHKSGQPPK